jgi:hypothetical protein
MELRQIKADKKGQTGGLITGIVFGIAFLVIGVIIAFIITSTLNNSSLLTANGAEANATTRLTGNFTSGIDNVSGKLPTVLLISAIVLILSVLGVLVMVWQRMRVGGGSI